MRIKRIHIRKNIYKHNGNDYILSVMNVILLPEYTERFSGCILELLGEYNYYKSLRLVYKFYNSILLKISMII